MRHYDSLDLFAAAHGGTAKWDRTLEAVANAPRVRPGITHSIGDSLTYRVTTEPDRTVLTGQRRYLAVRHVIEGTATVEVAPVASLTPTGAYSDLTDRREYAGVGRQVTLSAGSVLVTEIDEAIRDLDVSGHLLVLRVSVEGAFFANK